MSTIKVPSPEEVYRGTAPRLNPPSPKHTQSLVSEGETSSWGQPEPYLDILVTASSNFSSTYSNVGGKNRPKPSFSSNQRDSATASSEDYIFIPNLSHTGIVTTLVDPSFPIGVKVQSAVKSVYPKSEQKQLMDSLNLDLSKPVTTVTSNLTQISPTQRVTSPLRSQGRSQTGRSSRQSPQKRNVVLTNTLSMEDPYLDHNGRVAKPTKLHELVYNRRMMQPKSRRKTREAKEILKTMKRDLEEAKLKIPL
ncbi:hypothetical protein TL16_g09435 [Triparma laevis f. inornata]|uniref:Uncharacterized protein n=2 Tax=Triparma laevis TaxID=1534972 RepID=A0A9W7FIM8_9STRA|nr:hypothetical protein TL16_g09435 [Triparma laevis f. inornata]GMI12728.1 hypothetical protein TrLO_g15699 [Triparma laevis f. longispina]